MPRDYERITSRQSWSEESMRRAIEAVKKKEMGWLLASKTFGVPQATLRRHAEGTNKLLQPVTKGLGRFKLTFPLTVERQLVEHLKFLETRLFGLTRTSVQELAFQLAEKNGFAHKFNREKERAGQEWLDGFLRRNKDISLRKPEATSAARAQAFNKPQVQNFFKEYQQHLSVKNYKHNRIYNVDESSLSTVQKPQKILATTGRKQVGCITSAERGSNVTVVCCVNAGGSYIPPALIFPRKNMKKELIDDAPPGTMGVAQQSGWMTTEVFFKWIKHFQSYVKATVEDKVLLILDGHSSHKGIDALEYAKSNGIEVLCLPPHCTHRMQPLDVCFYGPLKTYFNQEISKWLKMHPGRVVTHLQIGGIFNEAYGKAATVQNACNGFKSTGLWPVNPDIFPEYMFEPAETTNIPLGALGQSPESNLPHDTSRNLALDATVPSTSTTVVDFQDSERHNLQPSVSDEDLLSVSTSTDVLVSSQTAPLPQNLQKKSSNDKLKELTNLPFPIEVLSPPPQGRYVSGQGLRKPKAKKSCMVLTSTPNMEELKTKNSPKPTSDSKRRKIIKQVFNEPEENEDQDPFQVDEDDDDCPCIYCNDLYSKSKPGEGWLMCLSCSHWAHAECAGLPSKTKGFICELCT